MYYRKTHTQRPTDDLGSGAFGAPRSGRKHNGIDYCADPGEEITAPASGTVTKLGYPYGDDLSYRYVEITDHNNIRHRVFYVDSTLRITEPVERGHTIIGTVQNIAKRYQSRGHMHNHFHYEIKDKAGDFINPLFFT